MNKNKFYLNTLIVAAAAGTQLLAVACNQEGATSKEKSALAALQQGTGTEQDSSQQDSPTQDEASQDTSGGTSDGTSGGESESDEYGDGSSGGTDDSTGDQSRSDNASDATLESDPTLRVYSADLKPVNDQGGAQNAGGTATFQIVGGTFTANVNATGLVPNSPQIQHIHTSPRCATMADDTNGDGWVDAVEEGRVSGEILIPLDKDLSQQVAGLGPAPSPSPSASPHVMSLFQATPGPSPSPSPTPAATPSPAAGSLSDYPTSDANGAYNYTQSTNISQMLADLRSPDPDPNDEVAKLEGNRALAPSSRVIVIHGVSPSTPLPPTVRSVLGLPAYLTVPVACGEIGVGSIRPAPSPSPGGSPSPSPAP